MHIKNIITSIFLFFIMYIFFVGVKSANAQAISQPSIGSITNINAGTDRIMEMIQSDEDEEKEIETSNDLPKTENKMPDIEIFYPSSELKNTENADITTKNDSDKTDDNKQNKTKMIVSANSGNIKIDTNNGEIKNKIVGGDIAFVRELKTSSGKLSIGGVVDYNHNNYDNKSDGIKGNGNSDSLTLGVLARQKRDDGVYYEGSIRMGRAKTDFSSEEIVFNDSKAKIEYEKSAPVYAGHAKLGKIVKIDDKNSVNIYGTYSFSHQDHTNVELSTKENCKFDSINSNRLKAGCRMTTKVKDGKIYYGLAYQYETSAKIKTKYEDTTTKITNGRGGSGILELGYKLNENKNNAVGLDLNATFCTGQQKGIIFQAQLSKSF